MIAWVAVGVCFANESNETWKTINVECAPSVDESMCYVSNAIQLNDGDHLTFDTITTDHANNVLTFNITYDAKIPFLPHGIFEKFQHLEQLKLSTGLKVLHHNDFENAWNLHNLTLSDNKLEHIPSSVFSRATNLMELNLDGNEILHLDNDAFNGLDKLYYLSMNKNRLITLKSFVFIGATHLTDLRLEYNEIEVLEPGVFDLPNLLFLYLGHNQLKILPNHCFSHAPLIGLDLRSNQLTHLGETVYNLKTLQKLILLNNHIVDLNTTRFNEMKYLVDLQVDRT